MKSGITLFTYHLFLILAICLAGCTSPEIADPVAVKAEIQVLMDKQVAEWNRGDIPAFMETYVKTDLLRFSSGGTVQRGWEETYDRYKKRYPNREAMGQLTFEDLEIKLLAEEWAEVHGRYLLKRGGDYSDATGIFTLLLQRTDEGWKILHDHTSAAESG